ncbi:hypothetical protein LAZ67_5004332 [Cordylochernes scorpioides]|uniref:Histone-lysine N-methyltransferase SETMAR n=1 Tax=Cordylochernes scorpioides TaxID=51811 RepID=A0ABY6KHU8_9ARAC|nr:hypothetical protein LAZ67_5004332 [Cordylochernes scorpioides]
MEAGKFSNRNNEMVKTSFSKPLKAISSDRHSCLKIISRKKKGDKGPKRIACHTSEIGSKKRCLFHHVNASPCRSNVAAAKLSELGLQLVSHPPYSTDLGPCDFFLFFNLNQWLGREHFHQMKRLSAINMGTLRTSKQHTFQRE